MNPRRKLLTTAAFAAAAPNVKRKLINSRLIVRASEPRADTGE